MRRWDVRWRRNFTLRLIWSGRRGVSIFHRTASNHHKVPSIDVYSPGQAQMSRTTANCSSEGRLVGRSGDLADTQGRGYLFRSPHDRQVRRLGPGHALLRRHIRHRPPSSWVPVLHSARVLTSFIMSRYKRRARTDCLIRPSTSSLRSTSAR